MVGGLSYARVTLFFLARRPKLEYMCHEQPEVSLPASVVGYCYPNGKATRHSSPRRDGDPTLLDLHQNGLIDPIQLARI